MSRELTTAESWDALWTKSQPTRGGLRATLPSYRTWLLLLGDLLDSAPPESEVLELGCAPGAMIELMHSLRPGHRYRGIDNSRDGLKIAAKRLAGKSIPAELHFGDIRDSKIAPADLVISFGLAEHFADPAEALRYHRRFVKPGGRVAVTVPNYSHPMVVRAMRWFSPETLETHNLEIMTQAALRAALVDAGFDDVVVGESGGPLLPNSRPRPGPVGRAYKLFGRAWNVVVPSVLPEGRLWSSSVWAMGSTR